MSDSFQDPFDWDGAGPAITTITPTPWISGSLAISIYDDLCGIHDGFASIANVLMVDGHVESMKYSDVHVVNAAHALHIHSAQQRPVSHGDCYLSHKDFWSPAEGIFP